MSITRENDTVVTSQNPIEKHCIQILSNIQYTTVSYVIGNYQAGNHEDSQARTLQMHTCGILSDIDILL